MPAGCELKKTTHRGIERQHPDRMPPGALGGVREVVLEPVDDLYGERILEQRDTLARRGRASAKIPEQSLRHPGQLTRIGSIMAMVAVPLAPSGSIPVPVWAGVRICGGNRPAA